MVAVYSNVPEFFNDIADEVRAYLGMVEVVQAEEGIFPQAQLYLSVRLKEDGSKWLGEAVVKAEDGGETTYTYVADVVPGNELVIKRHQKRVVKIAAFRVLGKLFPETTLPWGSLTGIRPTKLLRELYAWEGEEKASNMMREAFDVSLEKLHLAQEIVSAQMPILQSLTPKDVDVYIGIPFCKTRCLYCSFAAETIGKTDKLTPYLVSLKQDIALGARILGDNGYRLRSIYMGGGTPTVLSAAQLEELIGHALHCYGGSGKEFTVEAGRPDTIDADKLRVFRQAGVSRISINPQTMNQKTLDCIGRSHSPEEIVEAFFAAREFGFESINMDVIAGLPGEAPADFDYTLEKICQLKPDNLTVHTLAIKRSSRLKQRLEEFPLPPAQEAETMVKKGYEAAKAMGMTPYYLYRQKHMRGNLENVGYALPGRECIYNIDMMEDEANIMAHGAGAMTKRVFPGRDLRVERVPNPKDVPTYSQKIETLYRQKQTLFLQ